jgi:hypothetical protein
MKDVHPERNTFTFESKIVISSDFESGNLQYAEVTDSLNMDAPEQENQDEEETKVAPKLE